MNQNLEAINKNIFFTFFVPTVGCFKESLSFPEIGHRELIAPHNNERKSLQRTSYETTPYSTFTTQSLNKGITVTKSEFNNTEQTAISGYNLERNTTAPDKNAKLALLASTLQLSPRSCLDAAVEKKVPFIFKGVIIGTCSDFGAVDSIT
jgi:hypothetical protein